MTATGNEGTRLISPQFIAIETIRSAAGTEGITLTASHADGAEPGFGMCVANERPVRED